MMVVEGTIKLNFADEKRENDYELGAVDRML